MRRKIRLQLVLSAVTPVFAPLHRASHHDKSVLIEKNHIYSKSSAGAQYHHIHLETMEETQQLLQTMDDSSSRSGVSSPMTEDRNEVSSASSHHGSDIARHKTSWNAHEKGQSDSGISVRSRSPDQTSAFSEEDSDSESESEDGQIPAPQPPRNAWDSVRPDPEHYHHQRALADPDPMVQRLQDQEEELRQHILHNPQPVRFSRHAVSAPYEPPPTWNPYGSHMMYGPPGYPYNPYGNDSFPSALQHTENENEETSSNNEVALGGYDLIASKLSEQYDASSKDSIRPLYRRFEQLNHRILLHLQDEIAELEEEVQQIDQRILHLHSGFDSDQREPQSRRHEAHFGSEMHFRRTDLLGKVFQKLVQYNKAMDGYQRSISWSTSAAAHPGRCSQPSKSEVDQYRSWMQRNAPVVVAEAKFLQHEEDLIALPKLGAVNHSPRRFTALETCLIAFIPVPIAGLCMWAFS